MQIDSKVPIAGQPSLKVRAFFRKVESFDFFNASYVQNYFKLTPAIAKKLIADFVKLKYLEPTKHPEEPGAYWKLSAMGRTLSIASAGPAIKRKKAEEMLLEFLERAKLVNTDPTYVFKISRIVLFGSFLSEKESLGDVDLAIELKLKETDLDKTSKLREKKIREALSAGRRFSSYVDQLCWPEVEVWQFLKSRKKGLSLHPYSVHEKLFKKIPNALLFDENDRFKLPKSGTN